MKNIIKKLIMLVALVIIVVFVAGCTVNLPAESTTTPVPQTTMLGLKITCIDGKLYAGNICPDNIIYASTTTTTPKRVWGPADVSIKMITKEMGCDDIGGFYTLWPELTIALDFPAEAATITFTMTGGDYPEVHTLELEANGVYHAKDIYDYADTCDVVFQAEVTALTIR